MLWYVTYGLQTLLQMVWFQVPPCTHVLPPGPNLLTIHIHHGGDCRYEQNHNI